MAQDKRDILETTWGDGSPTEIFSFAPGTPRDISVSHRYLDDNPSGTPSDNYTIHLLWHDQHGAGNSGDLSVTVNNVPPTVDSGRDARIHEGATLARSGSFTDPGIQDTWTATVDYGDGSGVQPLALNPAQRFTLRHKYDRAGVFPVTVTVQDDDTGVGTATFLVSVVSSGH